MQNFIAIIITAIALTACAGNKSAQAVSASAPEQPAPEVAFDADSAYAYVARQVAFGPRVPNTEAHRLCGDWLASELRRHGAEVTEQTADLKAFDGIVLHARNIFGQINPEASDRIPERFFRGVREQLLYHTFIRA